MKRQILSMLLLIAGSATALKAQQLSANAGIDTVICQGATIMPHIGSSGAAIGGTAPYTYEWIYGNPNTASFYLSDITILQPEILKFDDTKDSMIYTLKITDANNDVATDQMIVYKSRFMWTLGECHHAKRIQDTISLGGPGVSSKFQPLVIEWSPAVYVSDVHNTHARVWTPVTQQYTSTATDRFGCKVNGGSCYVEVYPASVNDIKTEKKLSIYPNPITQGSMINIDKEMIGGVLKIYTADGRELMNEKLTSNKIAIGNLLRASSIYLYSVQKDGKTIAMGKLVTE